MGKIITNQSKILRLTNVIKYKCLIQQEEFNLNMDIEKMQSYIKIKGAVQIGPLIQYTKAFLNDSEELDMEILIMLQCNNYIHSVEEPYFMESVLRITNCMYCRYVGLEDKIKYAYDKLNLEAFENDILLNGESYTIFLERNEEENTIIADIFMPKISG